MTIQARIDRHRWLAWWLQQRRRRRHAPVELPSPGLQSGLVQFFVAQVGATFCRSWNEAQSLPANPFVGLVSPYTDADVGNYMAGEFVSYQLYPYREGDGGRVYAGASITQEVGIENDFDGIVWPLWTESPTWVTGYSIVRILNGVYAGFLDVVAATMFAGWTDTAAGWSDASELPCDFAHPPTTAKVLWNVLDWYSPPQPMTTVSSPLGGVAFDSTYGDLLARLMSDDLRRDVDGTMAYWVCPGFETGGVLSSLRGVLMGKFFGSYDWDVGTLIIGESGEINVPDQEEGDWYLLVMRNDAVEDRLKIDLLRLRDGAQFSSVATLNTSVSALTAEDDYLLEGIQSVLVLGGSWHWGVQGAAFYDRIGLWDRPLMDDEVLSLFNNGLGWTPD